MARTNKKVINIADKKIDSIEVGDNWDNFLSQEGILQQGKASQFIHKINTRLSQSELDNIRGSDSIANKLCDKPAEDMLRQGIDIDHKKSVKIYNFYENYNINPLLEQMVSDDRFYGGAIMVMDIDDGNNGNWSLPLNENNIRGINELFVLDRFFFSPTGAYNPIQGPEFYYMNGYESQEIVHKSRLIKMSGLYSGTRNSIINQSFGESVVYRCIQELRNFGFSHDIIPGILLQIVTNLFKFKDMTKKIQAGEGWKVKKKAAYLQAARNLFGAMVIDSEDEFIARTLNVNGVEKLIDMIERRLCSAAGMPHIKLLEESHTSGGGLGNGNSEQSDNWYDWIKAQQVKKLAGAYNRLNFIIAKILKFGTENPIKYEFCELKRQTQKEITENKFKAAQTKKIYFEMGLPGKKILESTFAQGYYSDEIELTSEEIALFEEKKPAATPVPAINQTMTPPEGMIIEK